MAIPTDDAARRAPGVLLLLLALSLALPGWLLTTASFTPLEHRASLSGSDASWPFQLTAPDWLFLESDLTVRQSGSARPVVVVSVNDQELTRLQPTSLYVGERSRTLIPISQTRAGQNQLRVRIEDAPTASFVMNLRVQNYHGINPRFPRAVVVADEAVATARSARGIGRRVLDLLLALGVWLASLWVVDRLVGRLLGVRAPALVVPAGVVLWAGVFYSLATPFHLWLSGEALVTLAAGPALLSMIAVTTWRHRRRLRRPATLAVLVVGVTEVGLRGVNRVAPTPIFYTESYGRYRGQPGAPFLDTHLNSRGFNDQERELAKPAGVHRIVAIGDSMAFGVVPRQHNYLARLETELSRPRRVEVVNMGVPGTSPSDYLAILVEEGLSFSPDLVLVNFYIGNDFEARRKRFYEYSFAATLAHFFWRVATSGAPSNLTFESSGGTYDDDAPTFGWERFLEIQVSRAYIYVDEAALRDAAVTAAGYLGEMHEIAARAGAGLLVAILPDEVQVDSTLQDRVVRAHGAPADRFNFTQPNELLSEELARRGIEHVDLTPVFRNTARERRLYKPQDTHWNIAGNQLAVTALADVLRDRLK